MRTPVTRIVQLRAVRENGNREPVVLWWAVVGAHRATGKPLDRVMPEHMPPFEGEEAWFLLERVPKGHGVIWAYWRALRQVEPPARLADGR